MCDAIWKKETRKELRKVANIAEEKGIIKPKPIIIPKNYKYDRISITRKGLGND